MYVAFETNCFVTCPECNEILNGSNYDLIVIDICKCCQKALLKCKKCEETILYEVPTRPATKKEKNIEPKLNKIITLKHLKKGLLKDQYNEFLKKGGHH